jgi:hypothetical protein
MDSWQRRLGKHYAQVQLFWNPLLTGVTVLALGPRADLGRSFLSSLLIAAVASSLCFVPVLLALALQERARGRGRPGSARGRAWYLALALLGMPPGLWLASHITEIAFGVRTPATSYDYRFAAFLGMLIAGLFFLWQTLGDARSAALAAELRLKQARAHQLEAQLAALTAQLNPHFLFNALNTIAALVPADAGRAERTVLRLAELYRGILAATRTDRHTLGDELEICRAYLDVEQTRFGERLQVDVQVAPEVEPRDISVPVLLLQPLVENAVNHGLSDRASGGTLRLSARRNGSALELEVADDGVGLGHSNRRGLGLGIETTRRRLELCYAGRASLELSSPDTGGTRALLSLPGT